MKLHILFLLFGFIASAEMDLQQLRAKRKLLATTRTRVIFDNDGMDAQFLKDHRADALLDVRTRQLRGTGVSTVFYCSRSSGLGVFTHNTRVGEVFDSQAGRYRDNATADFIKAGTDPLQIVTEFCRREKIEIFWTLRMNDCHDVIHRPDKPYPAFSKLKQKHPEWLMGTPGNRPRCGAWSAFDFAVREVRDLARDCVREVADNYDIDGIHLDFIRHPSYFRSTAGGGRATAEESEMMTSLLREIRQTTEARALQRKRPILLAVRVPDSPGYCRALGLDVETWMREGLIDLLIAGERHLQPWEESVDLGNKYGIPVIAGLSESRCGSTAAPYDRQSLPSYRSRASAAWDAGCRGLYLFNFYNAEHPLLKEIHRPELLAKLERHAFLNVRAHTRADHYLANGVRDFSKRPQLTPDHSWFLRGNVTKEVDFEIGTPGNKAAKLLLVSNIPASSIQVKMNGTPLRADSAPEGWQGFAVPSGCLRKGLNRVSLQLSSRAKTEREEYDGKAIWKQWSLRGMNQKEKSFGQPGDEGLLTSDRSTERGSYTYRARSWTMAPGSKASATVTVRHISGMASFLFANGEHEERIRLFPNRIEAEHCKLKAEMNTTDRFHEYHVGIDGNDFTVAVDGKIILDGRGKFTTGASGGRSMFLLGAASSNEVGEALWKKAVLETSDMAISDLLLHLPASGN